MHYTGVNDVLYYGLTVLVSELKLAIVQPVKLQPWQHCMSQFTSDQPNQVDIREEPGRHVLVSDKGTLNQWLLGYYTQQPTNAVASSAMSKTNGHPEIHACRCAKPRFVGANR